MWGDTSPKFLEWGNVYQLIPQQFNMFKNFLNSKSKKLGCNLSRNEIGSVTKTFDKLKYNVRPFCDRLDRIAKLHVLHKHIKTVLIKCKHIL